MMISKDFAFTAGHALDGLPEGHPCARVHGHNYRVRVEVSGPLSPPGWVIDYGDLRWFGRWLDDTLDHQWLGAGEVSRRGVVQEPVLEVNPTAENLAAHLRGYLTASASITAMQPGLAVAVGVSETPKTWAWCR